MTLSTKLEKTTHAERHASPEEFAYTLLAKTATRLEAELNRALRSSNLTSATYSILRILDEKGSTGSSCGDISEQLIAEVPDMTRLLDRLERLGYITRERSSIDRRMVRVTLSETGRQTLESLRGVVGECYVRQLGHLGSTKLSELSALLKLVVSSPGGVVVGGAERLESPKQSSQPT